MPVLMVLIGVFNKMHFKNILYLIALCVFFVVPRHSMAGAQAEPRSASFSGRLQSIDNIRPEISGKTIFLSQPWATPKDFFFVKNAYYFRSDGFVDSEFDIGVPWSIINSNTVCVIWPKVARSCYSAVVDSTGQAFLFSSDTKLLFKVEAIEDGDPLNIKNAYATRKKRLAEMAAREEQMVYAMLGLLGAVAGGGGFSGGTDSQPLCSSNPSHPSCNSRNERASSGSSAGAPPISPFYGSCHNPMGC